MNDCGFGVSPVIYLDPDPEQFGVFIRFRSGYTITRSLIISVIRGNKDFKKITCLIYECQSNIWSSIASLLLRKYKSLSVCREQVRSLWTEHAVSGLPTPTNLEGYDLSRRN